LPKAVIIGLSLYDEEAIKAAMGEAGVDAYVTKQTPAEEVIQTICRC